MNNLGYIVEVRKKYAIVMTEDSKFVRIKSKPGMIQGVLVEFPYENVVDHKNRITWYVSIMAAAAAIFILMFSIMQFNFSANVFMYVDIDINPSVEILIDKSYDVVKAEPLNEDGKKLMTGLKLEGRSIKDALMKVVEKSKTDGFVVPGKKNVVLISASTNTGAGGNNRDAGSVDYVLKSLVNMDFQDRNVIPRTLKITSEDRKMAVDNHISMGRYKIYKTAIEKKMDITLEEVRNSNISDILSKVQMDVDDSGSSAMTTDLPESQPENTIGETPEPGSTITSTPKTASTHEKLSPKPSPSVTARVQGTVPAAERTPGLAAGNGLRGEYYDNLDLTNLIFTRIDPTVDFNWDVDPPGPGISNDGSYSVRWTGQIKVDHNEEYTFYVTRDNGVRLWINNRLIIDQWNDMWNVTDMGKILLQAGHKYDIKLEYYNDTGAAFIKVEWSSQSTSRSIIPGKYLYPPKGSMPRPTIVPGDGTGLRAEYYDTQNLKDLKLVRIDPVINFNWGVGSPNSTIEPDSTYSVRWTGQIKPLYSEEYTFYITRDNGARLWIDNQLIIDRWNDKWSVTDTGKITLQAGRKYDIRLEYYNSGLYGSVKMEWSSAKTPRAVVPQSRLYPAGKQN